MNRQKVDGDVIDLIKGIETTIKKVGVKRFLELLKQIDPNLSVSERDKLLCDFIIAQTCDYKSVRFEDLRKPKLQGDPRDTRTLCIVLLKHHLGLRHEQISSMFGRNGHTLVSHAMREYSDMDEKIKPHREWLNDFNVLNIQIIEYKNKLMNNADDSTKA